jgi:hypothetical protein
MNTVSLKSQREDFDVFVSGQVVEDEPDKDQDPAILVDVILTGTIDGLVEVKLFGEELKQLLKGQTFFFRPYNEDEDIVRRILI